MASRRTSRSSPTRKPVALPVSQDLTPAEIESLRADSRRVLAELRRLEQQKLPEELRKNRSSPQNRSLTGRHWKKPWALTSRSRARKRSIWLWDTPGGVELRGLGGAS